MACKLLSSAPYVSVGRHYKFNPPGLKFKLRTIEIKTASRVGEAVAWDFYGGYLTSLSKEATCGRGKV